MAWGDVHGGTVRVTPSEIETRRFGLTFARATMPSVDSALEQLVGAVRDVDADVTVLRYDAGDVGLFARLVPALPERLPLFAGDLVYWSLRVGNGRTAPSPRVQTRQELEPRIVSDLVSRVFVGYRNHYAANPLLDPALVAAGYAEWAERTATGGSFPALVASVDGSDVAVATCDSQDGHVEILLAGVVEEARGAGVYPQVLRAVESAAAELCLSEVVISTQLDNLRVQRRWAAHGFEPAGGVTTVHLVRRELLLDA